MSKKLVFLSLVTTGLAACGSGSKDTTLAEFTRSVVETECDNVASACLVPKSECQKRRQDHWSEVLDQSTKSGRPFDPSNADACLSEVKSVFGDVATGVPIQPNNYRKMNQICARVFHGPATVSQACEVDVDCVDSLICNKGGCGKPVEVGPGKGCANIGEYCSQGYTCAAVGVTQQCVARATRGAACAADASCLENLRCSGSVCVDGLGDGQVCQADEDCDSGFCEPFAHKCGHDIRFAENSSSCLAFKSTDVAPVSPDASVD